MTRDSDHRQQPRTDNATRLRTLIAAAIFVIFGCGLLLYQLYALQLRDADIYRTEAVEQQVRDQTLPAVRGSIYSSTGKLLAKSNTVWNIIADPSRTGKAEVPDAQLKAACEAIAAILDNGTTADSIYAKMTDRTARDELYQYKVLAKGVEKPVADAILEWADTNRLPAAEGETGKRILYLSTEQTATRSYPYGAFLSSVLGFCDADGNGFYGLEKSYDEVLAGTPGRSIAETNVSGEVLAGADAEIHEAINGSSLHLTIDENIQAVVEQYLAKAVEDFNVQNRGCAIVMNVKTGAILAMATVEQFDPNDPYKIYDEKLSAILENRLLDAATTATLENRLGKTETEEYLVDGLIDDSEYSKLQGMLREAQWKNKNITELYYPGSVFKLVTAASALDSGLISKNQVYYCNPGGYKVNAGTAYEHDYRCAEGTAHGPLDMAGALNHSCNVYFVQTSEQMSARVCYDYFQAFGFTKPTGVDLPNETRWMIYYDADDMTQIKTNLYSASFGQNMAITPLQMATAVAAVVNGGYLVTPYVVESVTDESGNVVSETQPAIRRQVISEEVSAQLCAMMEDNVGHGDDGYHSCKNAYVAGYRIGGKSGTAEQLNLGIRYDGDFRKAISFAGVLPMDDPEIEVFVMMDDPRWVEDFASQIVAPVVGNIISEVAPYLGISQDPDYNPTGEIMVNNCVGRSWTDAQVQMNLQGFSHKLIGPSGTIVYQYPYAGTSVPAGSTIYLYTNTDQNQKTTVPDVSGKTGSFARQMLKAAGLNVRIEGDESARVISQSLEPEASAPLGEVILITTGETS